MPKTENTRPQTIGYLRVSTADQDVEKIAGGRLLLPLPGARPKLKQQAGVEEVFIDPRIFAKAAGDRPPRSR